MILPRGFDDIVVDRVKSALQVFLAEQILECETPEEVKAISFFIERDRTEPPGPKELPLVNVWVDSSIPEGKGSTARTLSQETSTINVDLTASYPPETDDASIPAGPKARARLLYLKEQTRHALYRLINSDFGFDPGVIAVKGWPTFSLYKDETGNPAESVVGGRWSFSLTYQWTAEAVTGVPLEEVAVNTALFSTLYQV